MFERYEYVSENVRFERDWWQLVKYGLLLPLIPGVPIAVAFWLWVF